MGKDRRRVCVAGPILLKPWLVAQSAYATYRGVHAFANGFVVQVADDQFFKAGTFSRSEATVLRQVSSRWLSGGIGLRCFL